MTSDRTFTYDSLYRLTEGTGREKVSQTQSTAFYADYAGAKGGIKDSGNPALRVYTQSYLYDKAGNITEMKHAEGATVHWNAGRELPSYFPRQPVHTLFNPEQRRWMEHQRLGKLELKQDGNTLRIEFAEDLDTHEVKELISYIPQEVKSRRVGHTLIVEAVSEFHHWLSKEDDSIWTRIKRWAGIA
ncbi:MAG: hypothetical protein GY913_06550 [Proteobacteria bacterium]|nr:hypothetical protein [Pseudomonadota bacterium]MCP4916565.1 hypothetical protein [Pseudomonadota bacterium]